MSESSTNIGKLVAICGKGGTGKTMLTSIMAKVIMEGANHPKLLLIDADPAVSLPGVIGVEVKQTIGEIREQIIKTAKDGTKEEKRHVTDMLDYMVLEAVTEFERFAILAMGRTETLGCYCPVNTLLKSTITALSKSFDIILVDGEAGMEQINRQVMDHIDTLIIVSDATERGMRTATQIAEMIEEDKVIQFGKMAVIFNRVQDNVDILKKAADDKGLEVIGFVPQDGNVASYDLVGEPLTGLPDDSPAIVAVRNIVEEHIWKK